MVAGSGSPICEDCHKVIPRSDIESYSIEADGIAGIDPHTGRWIPRTISIPRICEDCASAPEPRT